MIKSPFKFLDSYTKGDRDIFFGRDQEITELYRKVFESKMLLVYGISGTGKSSLVNCGLASRFDESDWLPVNVRRGNDIVGSLNDAFNKQAIRPLKKNLSVSEKLQSIYLDHFKPVYLIFDQFEELFIFGTQDERTEFVRILKDIARSKSQCRIILVIREEFLAGITEFEEELPEIFYNRFRVEKMKRTNAISAVEGPCKVFGIETEQGFSEELINKLCPAGNEIELTYLQIYLDRILRLAAENSPPFQGGMKGGSSFTISLLEKAGNVSDLLGQFLEEQIREMDDPETGMSILKSFVSVQGTKRQMDENQILDSLGTFGTKISEPDLLKYLTKFVDLRLLRERDEAGHFELRHDALASKIYEKFTALEKDVIDVRQFIENAYSDYEKRGKLLTLEDLKYIAPYEDKLYLNKPAEAFINNSKNEITKRRRRRRTIASIAGIALIIILSGFTIWALNERKKAIKEREIAETQKENALAANEKTLKAEAEAVKEKEKALSNETAAIQAKEEAEIAKEKALKAEAQALQERNRASENENNAVLARKDAETSKESALRSKEIADINYLKAQATSFCNLSQKIADTDPTAALNLAEYAIRLDSLNKDNIENLNRIYYDNNFYKVISRHDSFINSIAYSPDGKTFLTGSSDKKAILWDLQGNKLKVFIGHSAPIKAVTFSPDGKNILTGSNDKTARLWDLQGNLLQEFKGHEDIVTSVAFSPDGKYILTGSEDKTARLWDLNGSIIHIYKRHIWGITSVAFSPDGKYIVTGSYDGRIWGLNGNLIKVLRGHLNQLTSVAISPDSKYILTAAHDMTVRLWDIHGKELHVYEGHENDITSVAFSPDGNSILTGSVDKTARIWDLKGNELIVLKGHDDVINSAVFSKDGKYILTGSSDKTVRLWEIRGNTLSVFMRHQAPIYSIAFSPDGKSILTGSYDNLAILWDFKGNIVNIIRNSAPVYSVAFSPDGKTFLCGTFGFAYLWDLNGNRILGYDASREQMSSVAISPDGKNLLTGSYDGTARLWDLSGNLLKEFRGHSGEIMSVAFSPDGKNILSGASDRSAILWDLEGNILKKFQGHENIITSVAFSPNGKYILTGSFDNTARLWDIDGNIIQLFSGHDKSITSVAFSSDGKNVLTGSYDCTARIWDLNGNMLQIFRGHKKYITSVAFSLDNKYILTGSSDNTARLWEIKGTLLEFKQKNAFQEFSITQKIKYGILDYSDIIKLEDEKSLSEAADYYFENMNSVTSESRNEFINNALNLYEKLLLINNTPEYYARRKGYLMQLLKK
jgi:WD40 repeat protein